MSGYFGGINLAICMAYTCILYPKASTTRLLLRFFRTLRSFPWPQALYLCEVQEDSVGLKVWDKWKHADDIMKGDPRAECMPIITPAYPAMNSSFSVSLATREVLLEEFIFAENVCKILSTNVSCPAEWANLLTPYPFFTTFKNFLKIEVSAVNYEELKKWDGFVQSRIRNLTNEIQPYVKVRPWPRVYHGFTSNGGPRMTHFIGISKRRYLKFLKKPFSQLKNCRKKIKLGDPVDRFKTLINKNPGKTESMQVKILKPKMNELPEHLRNPVTGLCLASHVPFLMHQKTENFHTDRILWNDAQSK